MKRYLWQLTVGLTTAVVAVMTTAKVSHATMHHGMSVCWGCSGSEPYQYCDTLNGNGRGSTACSTGNLPNGTTTCTYTGNSCANGMLFDDLQADGSYQQTAPGLAQLAQTKIPIAYREGGEALRECSGAIVGRRFAASAGERLRAASADIAIAGL